jgi:PAS domain S-box-containing protein
VPRTPDEVARPPRRERPPRGPDNGSQAHAARPESGLLDNHAYDLIHGLNAIVWEADPKTLGYTFVSPRAEQILGYPAARWLAGNGLEFWTNLIHPEERERVVRFSLGELNAGRNHEIKYRALAADGRVVWLHEVVRRQMDGAGHLRKLCGLMVDITDCKRTEEQYGTLFNNASMGIYQSAPDGTILTANVTLAGMLGYDSPAELLGRKMSEDVYFDPDERARQLARYRAEAEEGVNVAGIEMLWKKRDGTPIWVHLNARSINDAEGRTLYYDGFAHDITERRRAEDARRESEERYRELFENANDFVYTNDLEWNFTSVNKAGEEIIGYTRDEVRKMNVVQVVAPEHREKARLMLERKLAGNDTTFYEVEVVARDGRRVPLEVNSRLILDKEGRAVGVQGIGRDITERKAAERALRASEERFRAFSENSTDAIVVLAADGSLIYDNPSNNRPLGYTPGELMGVSVLTIIHPEDLPRFQQLFSEAVTRPGVAVRGSFRCRHKDGRWRHIEATMRNLVDNPAVGGVVVNSRDVTEETLTLAELRRSETMSAMGALVAGVAHEVRNPLFSISATLDSFEARFGDREEYGKYFELLRGELGRMTGLMRELLDYSKPPSLELAPVAAGKVVTRAVRSCAPQARQARVRVLNEAAHADATLTADRKRLLQVFQNLLENAIHHSPSGGTVRVAARAARHDGAEWMEFVVEDEGPGFREEDLAHIFEPFFTRRRGGTGLGLSIVQRIVEEHHGHIEAANRDGGGAQMLVRLPLAPAADGGGVR